jgi:hypothetical protein
MKKLALVVLTLLAGCGNSLNDAIDSLAVSTFPLRSAFNNRMIAGYSENYTAQVGTNCSGTMQNVANPPVAATFETVTGFSTSELSTVTLTNCTPTIIGISNTNFMDSNYTLIGYSVPASIYGTVVTLTPLPISVNVGDSGTYVTMNLWTDATKTVSSGKMTISYLVSQNSKTVANITITTNTVNPANVLIATQVSKYTLSNSGTITPVSTIIDQTTATGTTHIVFNKV